MGPAEPSQPLRVHSPAWPGPPDGSRRSVLSSILPPRSGHPSTLQCRPCPNLSKARDRASNSQVGGGGVSLPQSRGPPVGQRPAPRREKRSASRRRGQRGRLGLRGWAGRPGPGAAPLQVLTLPRGWGRSRGGEAPERQGRGALAGATSPAQDHNMGDFCPLSHLRTPSPNLDHTRSTFQNHTPSPPEPGPQLHAFPSLAGQHQG